MIRYRAFCNTDPPALAELWCHHPPVRALVQPMTVDLLDQRVFSKPYFDRCGLIVAEQGDRLLGFAHAGFGSDEAGADLSTDRGATCLLMVSPHQQHDEIAAELLRRSESYLVARGARRLLAGSVYPVNPFYLGLYGSSHSPGVLESDEETVQRFRAAGYQQQRSNAVLQRPLAGFRPVIDRQQMQLRRGFHVEPEVDPPTDTWWQACTIGQTERIIYRLVSRRTSEACGAVTMWDLERSAGSWGVHAMGMMELQIVEAERRKGLGTYLVGEALRHLHSMGTAVAVIQVEETNEAASALFRKLGFEQVDRSLVLCRDVEGPAPLEE